MTLAFYFVVIAFFVLFLPFYVEVLSMSITLGKFKAIRRIAEGREQKELIKEDKDDKEKKE